MVIAKEIRLPRKHEKFPKVSKLKAGSSEEVKRSVSPKNRKSEPEKLEVPSHISNECREVIELMLKKEPGERISLFDLLHHPWLHSYQHENKQMWEESS